MKQVAHQVPSTGWVKIGTPCVQCRGNGTVADAPCTACNATGEKVIDVSLSAFVNYISQEFGNEMRRQGVF